MRILEIDRVHADDVVRRIASPTNYENNIAAYWGLAVKTAFAPSPHPAASESSISSVIQDMRECPYVPEHEVYAALYVAGVLNSNEKMVPFTQQYVATAQATRGAAGGYITGYLAYCGATYGTNQAGEAIYQGGVDYPARYQPTGQCLYANDVDAVVEALRGVLRSTAPRPMERVYEELSALRGIRTLRASRTVLRAFLAGLLPDDSPIDPNWTTVQTDRPLGSARAISTPLASGDCYPNMHRGSGSRPLAPGQTQPADFCHNTLRRIAKIARTSLLVVENCLW